MFSAAEIKLAIGAGMLVVLLVGFGLWSSHERSIGEVVAHADELQRDLTAERDNRTESDRRTKQIQEKANAADQKASAAAADADAARSAGDRLRVRLAAAERARDSAVHPAVAGASAPGYDEAPQLVPFDMFEGLRVLAGQAIAYADDVTVRLDACVGAYDSLTPSPSQ